MHLLLTGLLKKDLTWNLIDEFFRATVATLELVIISGPYIYRKEGGDWIAITIIAESHLSIHTWDGTIYLDVFSCKVFDVDKLIELIHSWIEIEHTVYQLIERKIPSIHHTLLTSSPSAPKLHEVSAESSQPR